MKSMSAVVEKLHDTGSNVGENLKYLYPRRCRPDQKSGKRRVDGIATSHQCRSCLRHEPHGLIKCYCGKVIKLTQEYVNRNRGKILETLSIPWKVRLYSRGLKHGPRQWQEDHRRAKEHLRGVRKQ